MILLIIGMGFILSGFLIKCIGKKKVEDDDSLRLGIIKSVVREEADYRLEVSYSPYRNEQTQDITIYAKHKPISNEIILSETENGIMLYKKEKLYLFLPLCLWVIGALLCLIA